MKQGKGQESFAKTTHWSQQTPSSNTREDSTHGHHQKVNTEIRLIIFFAAKDEEALYSQGADCGSDHELLIAKFRLKLKKIGKTARPFRQNLNQSSKPTLKPSSTQKPTTCRARHTMLILQQCRNTTLSIKIQAAQSHATPIDIPKPTLDTSLHSREKKSSTTHQNSNTSFPNQETLTSH